MPTLVSSGDITISDINDGLSAQLSKESHIVPTDSDGSNPDFTGCQTTISIFLGSIDDSLNWTIIATPSAGLTGSLNVRTYTVTALTGSVGYVDLTASKVGFPSITARFTVTKLADGANGTRIAVLEMYQWAASAPTSFPDGTSTYTWATGTFTAPTTPNGWTLIPGAPVSGQTLWGISVVVSNTETTPQSIVDWDSNVVYAVGAAGSNGAPGTAYWLTSSVPAVQKSIAGVYTPTSITYNLIQAIGSSAPTAYAGRFIIATSTDGSAYTSVYTSEANESSKSYIVPTSIKTIRVRAYLTDGATLVDELITTIVSDGATGTTGARGLNFSEAKILYTDLTFQTGVNGISVYNNSGGGTVTHTRVARLADSPFTDSNFNLEISNTGAASPGLGGFTHVTQTRASAIFVQRFIAKVPVGYTLSYHNNAFGTGATASWLTSNAGTGTFQEYIVEWRCGSTGTFSSITFIALNGTNGTPEVPVKWWLASSTVYDFTAIGFATTIGVLSNESHTVPTDSSGNNGNFAGANSTLTIYNGTVDDSANWAVTANPVNVTGSLVGKTYTVTALSADTGYVDLTATRSGFTNIVKRFSLTKSRAGVNGTDGVNGTRTAVLDVYRWSATTPTTFPSGTSTYTWATGQFTAPATLNGWSLTPPAPVLGQTLWSLRQLYADTGVSTTSSITWSANTPTSLSAAGTNGSNGSNGTRTAILELYRWSATTPTTFPSGTSTYTWATGAFTAPATLNSWALLPGASVPGQTLWGCSVAYSDQLTTTTSSVTWNTSTAYAVGAAGANALQISVVATQWDYRDDDAIWGIKINDVLQAGAARGHKLVVLNPATGVVSINQNYDTYGSEANTDSLAAAINGVADGQIVILTTFDATQCNQNLRNALRLCGSESVETWTAQRKSHAFIGQKGLPIGAAYEKTGSGTTAAGTSKVAAYFTTSGIVRNGSTAFNAVSAILSNEAHVFPASTSGVVSSYVGSGTEIRVYDGTTLLTYDGSGTLPGTWKIATVPTNITIGTITDSGSFATIADHSGVAEGIDTAAIIYTITGKSIINGDFTLVKAQTFSKAKAGVDGESGIGAISVVLSNESHVFPATTNNIVSDYRNSGTKIQVFEGVTELNYDGIGTANSTWTVSNTPTNITAGQITKNILGEDWQFQPAMGGDGWALRAGSFSPEAGRIYDIAWSGSQFCAVGQFGKVATSINGIDWTFQPGLSDTAWGESHVYAVVWTGEKFVVVGSSGKVATSADGSIWTFQPTNLTETYIDIAWSGSLLCAVGGNGDIATSPDGITWTARSRPAEWSFRQPKAVIWSGSKFVIVGSDAGVATSTDGITWVFQSNLSTTSWGTSADCYGIAWNGSIFCVVGQSGKVATSADGEIWAYQGGLITAGWNTSTQDIIYSIIWAGTQFVVGGTDGAPGIIATGDAMASSWTIQSAGLPPTWSNFYSGAVRLASSGTFILAAGYEGRLISSPTGATWSFQSGIIDTDKWGANDALSIAISPDVICMAGDEGKLAISKNGIKWDYISQLASNFGLTEITDVAWNGQVYCAVGGLGKAATSPDGITWTYQPKFNTAFGNNSVNAIAWNGTVFCAVGNNGYVATSPDGIIWTSQGGLRSTTWGTAGHAYDIVWNGSIFCVVGGIIGTSNTARAATSSDGIDWVYQTGLRTLFGSAATRIIWANNNFYVTSYGAVLISPNGVTWTRSTTSLPLGSNYTLSVIAWSGSVFVMAGTSGLVATSTDGLVWTIQNGLRSTTWGTTGIVYTILWDGTQFVVGGENAKVATSDNGVNWVFRSGVIDSAWSGTLGVKPQIQYMLYANSQYIAVGPQSNIALSTNSIDWQFSNGLRGWQYQGHVNNLSWVNDKFYAIGEFANIATSVNGENWDFDGTLAIQYSDTASYFGLTQGADTIVIVGEGGAVASNANNAGFLKHSGIGTAAGSPTTSWEMFIDYPDSTTVVDIANSGSVLCAISNYGEISTSSDGGIHWTLRAKLRTTAWGSISEANGVIWANNLFVAFGQSTAASGSALIATSPDGITWTNQTGFTAAGILGIAWSGTLFCATGYNGAVLTSSNGITWTTQTGLQTVWGTIDECYDVTWAGAPINKFVIVGSSGKVATSSEGLNWDLQTSLSSSGWGTSICYGISWNGSTLCVVGASRKAATSSDGINWVYQTGLIDALSGTLPLVSISTSMFDIIWDGTQFYAVGGALATSTNGVTWVRQSQLEFTGWGTAANALIHTIIKTGSKYIVGGEYAQLANSSDGVTWDYQGDILIAGSAWDYQHDAYDVIWANNKFIAVGQYGKVATSADAITWAYQSNLSDGDWTYTHINSIAYGNGILCIAGDSGKVATSSDGVTWTNRPGLSSTSWSNTNVNSILWNVDKFYVFGDNGKIASSPDGVTWLYEADLTTTEWGTTNNIYAAATDGETIYVTGTNGYAAFSEDFIGIEDHSNFNNSSDVATVVYTITGTTAGGDPFSVVKQQTLSKVKTGATGDATPVLLVTPSRSLSFTSTDGTLDGSQANIVFTANPVNITNPTYTWTFSGLQINPSASTSNTQTITSSNFGTSKSALITCTVNGTYVSSSTINRIERSTAAAGATVGATIGVNLSGQITSANASTYIANTAIGTAQIADASIETLKIAGSAVTVPASAYTAAAFTLSTAFQVIQSVVIDLQSDIPIPVIVTSSFTLSGATVSQFRILRGTTVLFTSGEIVQGTDGINKPTSPISIVIGDTAPIGTSTYYLEARYVSGYTARTAATRNLTILGVKK